MIPTWLWEGTGRLRARIKMRGHCPGSGPTGYSRGKLCGCARCPGFYALHNQQGPTCLTCRITPTEGHR